MPTSLKHAFKNAIRGINYTIKNERNFRIHICFAIDVIWFSVVFGASQTQIALFCVLSAVVMGMELLNTAIEFIADMAANEYNRYIRQIKDICAGAVMISAVFSVVCAVVVFWDINGWQRVFDYIIKSRYNIILVVCAVLIEGVFIVQPKKKGHK